VELLRTVLAVAGVAFAGHPTEHSGDDSEFLRDGARLRELSMLLCPHLQVETL
jgi:hypothetical protein